MPTIPLHLSHHLRTATSPKTTEISLPSPLKFSLPPILQTPTGLALLEIQGTINLPPACPGEIASAVGKLVFPNYDPSDPTGSKAWMKTVHLYVGRHQRLTGEVRKLPTAVGVVRKREVEEEMVDGGRAGEEELEIMEILEWKVVFSNRPEPVGG